MTDRYESEQERLSGTEYLSYMHDPHAFVHVPHYYGDIIRQVFILVSVLLLLAAPFYAENLRAVFPFSVIGAVVLIGLGALGNPHNKNLMLMSAVASGVGLVLFEVWALNSYDESTWAQFLLRELIAILFIIAFYFSMKTVRAFSMHQIGKRDEVDEFDDAPMFSDVTPRPAKKSGPKFEEFMPWTTKHGKGPAGAPPLPTDSPRSESKRDDDSISLGIGGR